MDSSWRRPAVWALLPMFVVALAASPGQAAGQEATPSMDDLAVLVGCWEGGMGPVQMREQWSDAEGGVMLGTTRYFREGVLVSFEFGRIVATDTAIVLWPYPGGQQSPRGFPLVRGGTEVTFENLEHDFPVRIIYRVQDDDHLAPRIEGSDGDGRGWELVRTACTPG